MTPFITTFTKRRVNPLDVRTEDIVIEDIAHALACCNRFAGHARRPISVAQHSVYVSRLCSEVDRSTALQGLLHDASEAYLGDVTKWLKMSDDMRAYREAEDRAQTAIFRRFECELVMSSVVEAADKLMVRVEAEKAYGRGFVIGVPGYDPVTPEERWKFRFWPYWSWRTSEEMFMVAFRSLTS